MYFHVVYGGARRRYGGAGRNSLNSVAFSFAEKFRTQSIVPDRLIGLVKTGPRLHFSIKKYLGYMNQLTKLEPTIIP